MKRDKQIIIDFAKELYLQYDGKGNKVYSLRNISTDIQQKFNKTINYSTIKTWADKFKWDELNTEIKKRSIQKALDDSFSEDELIIEDKSEDLANDYRNNNSILYSSIRAINNIVSVIPGTHPDITLKDAMSLYKIAMDIKFKINDIPDKVNPDEIEIPIIKFIRTKK